MLHKNLENYLATSNYLIISPKRKLLPIQNLTNESKNLPTPKTHTLIVNS